MKCKLSAFFTKKQLVNCITQNQCCFFPSITFMILQDGNLMVKSLKITTYCNVFLVIIKKIFIFE